MTRRFLTMLFGALVLCGFVVAEDKPAIEKDKTEKPADPPRLKRKKRDGVPPVEPKKEDPEPIKEGKGKEPIKEGKGKEPPVKDKKGKGVEPKVKDEPLQPEDGPMGDPEEDDKDILERLAKNMRAVEDKISNKELGEPTEQQQRDILKDIDALINRKQQDQGGGGGGGGQDDKDDKKDDQQPKGGGMGGMGGEDQQPKGGGGKSRAQKRREERQQAKNGGRQPRREPKQGKSGGTKMAGGKDPKPGEGKQPKPGGSGNEPGKGGTSPPNGKEMPIDPTAKEWGHLPESLRAEMNAYSNPQPFMPRYDDLIKKYYRTIAEKGRKKGD